MESLPTHCTCVRFLIGVSIGMCSQVFSPIESFLANHARVRFFIGISVSARAPPKVETTTKSASQYSILKWIAILN